MIYAFHLQAFLSLSSMDKLPSDGLVFVVNRALKLLIYLNYFIMMNNKMFMLRIASAVFLASCNPKEKTAENTDAVTDSTTIQTTPTDSIAKATPSAPGDTSENALDWPGTYEAVVPCADCPGIKTNLTINNDKTFIITEEYIDRNSKSEDKGTFDWDAAGSVITLKGKTASYKYKVGENTLKQLDMDGKEITGPNKDLYVFKKK